MNFDNIGYLQNGNSRQQKAYSTLMDKQIFSKLRGYSPILVGTIPIRIDIENSDLDIICFFDDEQEFQRELTDKFGHEKNFKIRAKQNSDTWTIVTNFDVEDFEIEIFGQNIPTKQQYAYRHLIIEHKLLIKNGEDFRQQIIKLKRQGHKTEPAFAIALDLSGDPYMELLKFEANE